MLTGKAKQEFLKWFLKEYPHKKNPLKVGLGQSIIESFYNLPDSMKWGVYVDFFENNSLWIEIIFDHPKWGYQIFTTPTNYKNPIKSVGSFEPSEARKAAIEKANEIYNSR